MAKIENRHQTRLFDAGFLIIDQDSKACLEFNMHTCI